MQRRSAAEQPRQTLGTRDSKSVSASASSSVGPRPAREARARAARGSRRRDRARADDDGVRPARDVALERRRRRSATTAASAVRLALLDDRQALGRDDELHHPDAAAQRGARGEHRRAGHARARRRRSRASFEFPCERSRRYAGSCAATHASSTSRGAPSSSSAWPPSPMSTHDDRARAPGDSRAWPRLTVPKVSVRSATSDAVGRVACRGVDPARRRRARRRPRRAARIDRRPRDRRRRSRRAALPCASGAEQPVDDDALRRDRIDPAARRRRRIAVVDARSSASARSAHGIGRLCRRPAR